MASAYFTAVTDLGTKKMLEALNKGEKLNITEFAVGDGEGRYYIPEMSATELKNEVWRGRINACYISGESENLLIIEAVIPSDIGGFTIREMGVFDKDGILIAICNTPDTQKVKVSDGVVHELDLSMELALTNTDSVELIIDPNVVTATKKDIKALQEQIKQLEEITGKAEGYEDGKNYLTGDYCTYNGIVYKCVKESSGEWDLDCWEEIGATTATQMEVQDALKEVESKLKDNTVSVKQEVTEGVKIATISIGEEETPIYAQKGGGSVIKGVAREESLYLQRIYAMKEDIILAESVISMTGEFTLSGITETGRITIKASDGADTAETMVKITSYSLYEIELHFYILYGFHIADNESNPEDKLTYISGCANESFTPAEMDYAKGEFNLGSWTGAHSWFFPKPCMLQSDGTVAYYLDEDDYTKREDGFASDIAVTSFDGNAMMEWGQNGRKIWIKVVPNAENAYEGDIYICDKQLDEDFHAWSFINNHNELAEHFYTPIYNGSVVANKLRSMSGLVPAASCTAQQEIDYAKANNTGNDVLWYTETLSDRFTVNVLLLLMVGTTDTKKAYGNGNIYYKNDTGASIIKSGTMNGKGLFWGSNSITEHIGVKVFGMENWWGNQWRRIAGYINDKGVQKIKMTYGTADSSTAESYNTAGNGYITLANSTPDGTSGGFTSKMIFHAIGGMIPKTTSGSETTHYTDGNWFDNTQVNYAFVGGYCVDGLLCGALCSAVSHLASITAWAVGATLSYKPLAAQGEARSVKEGELTA